MKLLNFEVGIDKPLFVMAGPCVVESEQLAMDTAGRLKEITNKLNIPFIYKSSFDKANRSFAKSFRGLGLEEGLRILAKVKKELDVAIVTDVHEDTPLDEVASVVDILQTPAFLCRQTNFIQKVAQQGLPVNIKKCAQLNVRWYLMRHTPYNYQVVKVDRREDNESLSPYWHVQL
jgi:2-dehydro-3-deoxyphosphooctonate aldolase (KDO 8-P synthase)